MVVRVIFFLNSANLICRGTDISKYFRDSLGIRDNESRLYFIAQKMFLLNILEAVLAYDLVKIRFMKEKEMILNRNTNDKSRGIESNQGS